MGIIRSAGRVLRAATIRKSTVIARCESGHPLTSEDVAIGLCSEEGCPTLLLFPEKRRVPDEAGREDR
jgi:hypothetical protein